MAPALTERLPPEIHTERLLLRPPSLTDAQTIFERWTADPVVTRYMSWPTHRSVDDTEQWLTLAESEWRERGKQLAWMLERLDESPSGPLGTISVHLDAPRAMVGYCLARTEWGQGLMPEAVRALVELLTPIPAVERIWAYCDIDNHASARVLEKCGFEAEGTLHRWCIHPNFAPTARDVRVFYRR